MMHMRSSRTRNYEMDMCNGPLFTKLVVFAVPVMISGILQLLFNAADVIVVGRFAGRESMAAVGSTTSLINLLINLFIGLSIGTNVLVAQFFGAKKEKELEETIHTSMLLALLGGFILIAVGGCLAGPILTLMGTPEDVLYLAILYVQVYFIGMPATLLYNFGSAILRAVGDTRRPLYYLVTAGIINVILNLFFVIVCKLDVAGVALASTLSQCVSAALVVRSLAVADAPYHLNLRRLRLVPRRVEAILKIGLPAGLQGSVFSISNVLIQSSINSFGSVAMAGSSAAASIENFVYIAMNAMYQTSVSFTSQNYGAKKYGRMTKILVYCLLMVTFVGVVTGVGACIFGRQLLGIYSPDEEVIQYGMRRMIIVCAPYFICGLMDTMVGGLRGMGHSIVPMFVSLTGACLFRVFWIFTVFAANRTLDVLYYSYPISWTITFLAHVICYLVIRCHMRKMGEVERAQA